MAFDFEFTKDHLAPIIPGNNKVDEWYEALCDMLPKYGITSERRVAHFLSQCAHESANFKRLEEKKGQKSTSSTQNSILERVVGLLGANLDVYESAETSRRVRR